MNERDCAVIEARIFQHEKQLTDIIKSMNEMKEDIAHIQASISQIRSMAYGAIAFYAISNIGLLEALNLVS
jgi:hypothetical protein